MDWGAYVKKNEEAICVSINDGDFKTPRNTD